MDEARATMPTVGNLLEVPSGVKKLERHGISLTATLAVSLGPLVLLSVAVVLFFGLWSAQRNTLSLLSDKASLTIDSAGTRIEQHLMPASDQSGFIAELIVAGTINIDDKERFKD
jgi:hypothetical protein